MEKLTPMMEQYMEIKKQNRDAILLFHLGDFYEMFFEDAEKAVKILHIALTARRNKGGKIPMAGIPCHAARNYIARLVKAGCKVAVCEQVEDPKLAKGVVKRETTRIITPGTVLDSSLLEEKSNNYLVAVNRNNGMFGFAVADVSTGEFMITEVGAEEELMGELTRFSPRECLLPVGLAEDKDFTGLIRQMGLTITPVEDWKFLYDWAYRTLTSFLRTHSLEGFGAEDRTIAVGCGGALVSYLEETQKTALGHINRMSVYSVSEFMVIDRTTQRNLELVLNMSGGRDGTLLAVLDKTVTAMGGRILRRWILRPLVDVDAIKKRQKAVKVFTEDVSARRTFQKALSGVSDIERLVSRVVCKTASARDLIGLKNSFSCVGPMKESLRQMTPELLLEIEGRLSEHKEIAALISDSIVEEPPVSVKGGGLIRDGFDEELDKLRVVTRDGKSWIAELQATEIKRTGISSLKVRYNKVFGYYIEVTKANLHLVPSDYIRKQTLVNSERFITPGLKDYESRVLTAGERIEELEHEIFVRVRDEVAEAVEQIQQTARELGVLDVLICFAGTAITNGYNCPQVSDDDEIVIEEGRHPVLESVGPAGDFVANDTSLDRGRNRILIITGPNMSGKSTYIRQVGLIVLMAQMGSFVPAASACIGIVDRMFTRVGALDELMRGRSTFMVEMNETANILNNATARSLIILDEIGRGTSTFDGVSIAWAVAEYLHNHKEVSARTLFATHFHELTSLASALDGIRNYNVSAREWNGEVVFLRKVVPGAADRSYGIHVARLAGLPAEVLKRAGEILKELEDEHYDKSGKTKIVPSGEKRRQMELFAGDSEHPIVDELRKLTPDNMSPMEALRRMYELKKKVGGEDGAEDKDSSGTGDR